MPEPIWTMTCPVVSTSHLRQGEFDRLCRQAGEPHALVLSGYLGCMVYVGDLDSEEGRHTELPGLHQLISLRDEMIAEGHKFDWIRFDPDGSVIDGCETFDW